MSAHTWSVFNRKSILVEAEYFQENLGWESCVFMFYVSGNQEFVGRRGMFLCFQKLCRATGGKNWDSLNFATWKCLLYKSTQKTCID